MAVQPPANPQEDSSMNKEQMTQVSALLAEIVKARRAGPNAGYANMHDAAKGAMALLHGVRGRFAAKILCSVYYELAMWAHQEGLHSVALGLTQASLRKAMEARDQIGSFFAKQNIGGLHLPGLGLWKEAITSHWRLISAIQTFFENTTNDTDYDHAIRIQMNVYAHLIRITFDHKDEPGAPIGEIEGWLNLLKENPCYKDNDHPWKKEIYDKVAVCSALAAAKRH